MRADGNDGRRLDRTNDGRRSSRVSNDSYPFATSVVRVVSLRVSLVFFAVLIRDLEGLRLHSFRVGSFRVSVFSGLVSSLRVKIHSSVPG